MPDESDDISAVTIDTGVAGAALGAVLMELELEFPGIIDRAANRLENHQLRSAVISLRGPRIAPKILRDIEAGVAWLRVAAMIANAALGPAVKGKRRRR
jgi:hypothetical protein